MSTPVLLAPGREHAGEEAKVVLGGRQTIYFVELDGPPLRNFVINIPGAD